MKVPKIYFRGRFYDVYNNSSVVYIDSMIVNNKVYLFTMSYTCCAHWVCEVWVMYTKVYTLRVFGNGEFSGIDLMTEFRYSFTSKLCK